MSEEKFIIKISQVDRCVYKVEFDKLVITISTTDQSEEACIDAFVLVYGIASTLEVMSRAREIAKAYMNSLKESMEGVM
jgi:hypothetical protein